MTRWILFLNSLLIVIICGVLASAFGVQIILREEPCPLCLLQRVGMTGVAFGAFLNLLYGVRLSSYGVSIFSSVFGGLVALRQIALHVCPQFPTFGTPVLGLDLYVWSFLVFVCSVAYIGLLLFLQDSADDTPAELTLFDKLSIGFFVLVLLGNIYTSLDLCGFGVCPL